MSREKRRPAESITQALRHASALSMLVSQSVATKVGLNTTDLECLDFLLEGLISAGELSRKTGLSTGAITTVLDRLERAGYVKRQPDPNDRRRVLVAIQPSRMEAIWLAYAPLRSAMEKLYKEYSSADLLLIAGFTERAATVSAEFVRRLQEE